DRELARILAQQVEDIMTPHLRSTLPTLVEHQAVGYAQLHTRGLDLLLSLAVSARGQDTSATPAAAEAMVRSRALALDEIASRRRSLAPAGDAMASQLESRWVAARTRLANLTLRASGDELTPHYRSLIAEERSECDSLESALAFHSALFRRRRARAGVGLDAVTQALPRGCALVSYVRYDWHEAARTAPTNVDGSRAAYAALILRSGERAPE